MTNPTQSKINIEPGLKQNLQECLKSREIKRLGYNSQAQFVTKAIMKLLIKLKSNE